MASRRIQPPERESLTGVSLAALLSAIRACTLCRDAPRGKPLPVAPRPVLQLDPRARILVAGQAPGTRVHASGRPFTDPSGVRLRHWMGIGEDIFYDPAKVAVVPMGFCFPGHDAKGGDLPPRRECVLTWHDRLFAAWPKPALTLAVGLHAVRYHVALRGRPDLIGPALSPLVDNWRTILDATGVMPMPHPSWRNNAWIRQRLWFTDELLPCLRQRVALILGESGVKGAQT
jgi:uracil-DNA glycosylase